MGDAVADEPITGSKIRQEQIETASVEKFSLEGIDPHAEWPIDEKREKALVRKMGKMDENIGLISRHQACPLALYYLYYHFHRPDKHRKCPYPGFRGRSRLDWRGL